MSNSERALEDVSMCGHSESERSLDKAERSRRGTGGMVRAHLALLVVCWFYTAPRRSCLDSSHNFARARPLLPSWACLARTRWLTGCCRHAGVWQEAPSRRDRGWLVPHSILRNALHARPVDDLPLPESRDWHGLEAAMLAMVA